MTIYRLFRLPLLILGLCAISLNAAETLRFDLVKVNGTEYETLRTLKEGSVITLDEVEMGITVLAFPSDPRAYRIFMGPNGQLRGELAGDHHLGLFALMGDWKDKERGIAPWKPKAGAHTLTAKVHAKNEEHLATYEIIVVVE